VDSIVPRSPELNPYNPNHENRRCPTCDRRAGWRRSIELGGAWVHCTAGWDDDSQRDHRHACTPSCILAVIS
jgi:hypothetical protein